MLLGCSGWRGRDWSQDGSCSRELLGTAFLEASWRAGELGLTVNFDGVGFFEETCRLQFSHCFLKGANDIVDVLVGVGGGDVGGEAFKDEDAALAEMEEEEVTVFAVLAHPHKEAGVEPGEADGDLVVDHELVHGLVESLGFSVEVGPELRPLLIEMGEDSVSCRDAKRMAHECAGEESNVAFGEGVVAEFPMAAVEGVHVLGFAGHDADGESAADHFTVGGDVGDLTP